MTPHRQPALPDLRRRTLLSGAGLLPWAGLPSAVAAPPGPTAIPTATAAPAVPSPPQTAAPPPWAQGARCVVPAKPGGGFDLTCQLLQAAWPDTGPPLVREALPGGIGALAYDQATRQGRADARRLVAFSSGTLLNLAQGRFGPHTADEVRWLAALALDHGVVAVHRNAPWPDLPALVQALREDPGRISFGIGGTLGSQDWLKAAWLAREAGVSHKALRVVAFEGGGDAAQALAGRHVQVCTGDAAETGQMLAHGAPLRVLAVLAATRRPGRWRQTPTAREQGLDLAWPIVRGVYVGREVPAAQVAAWRQHLLALQHSPAYAAELQRLGLEPVPDALPPMDNWVPAQVAAYRELLGRMGLPAPR